MNEYTHFSIEGKLPQQKLPENWGLVLEGGGTRGCFTAGVLDAFLKENIHFPYIVGVSSGVAHGLSYVSGQLGRNRLLIEHHIPLKKYMGFGNFFKKGSFINRDYVCREVPEKHSFFDWESFHQNDTTFLTGAFHCKDGTTHWFGKDSMNENMEPALASTALPFVSPMVEIDGNHYLDGGMHHAIPIEKSIEDGNEFHVIVLTQNEGYEKKESEANSTAKFAEICYKKYPKIIETMEQRHHVYNAQLKLCEQLVEEGRAIVLRPQKKLKVGGADRNVYRLLSLFLEGEAEGQKAVEWMREMTEGGHHNQGWELADSH